MLTLSKLSAVSIYGFFCLLVVVFGAQAGFAGKPVVVNTILPSDDVVVATEVVNAPPDESVDAAPIVQAAIDRAAADGGGIVYLSAGRFRINSRIVVKPCVTLRGDWMPPTHKGWERGTILMINTDRGNAEATATMTLTINSGVCDVAIWYPDQNAQAPTPYPWAIGIQTQKQLTNACPNVTNVTLVNAYKGITIGPAVNWLFMLQNIYGTPLNTGISIDACFDIGRTQNLEFSEKYWEEANLPGAPSTPILESALRQTLMKDATALDLGRDEWGYLYDVRVKGYGVGMILRPGNGKMNGVMFGCKVLDCGIALKLTDVSKLGIGITGCTFEGRDASVLATGTFDGVAQFNSCTFKSAGPQSVHTDGVGVMTFQNCEFAAWKDSAIYARAGMLNVMDCRFDQPGSHISLGADVSRAIILSNTFAGAPGIKSVARQIDLQINHHKIQFAHPDVSLLIPAPILRPATSRLFNVDDYGASPLANDNTGAFQKALTAARSAGGGTVFVPAGMFRFKGQIVVPTGVELRGGQDLVHHSLAAGSAMLPTAGRGDAQGAPFISLEPHSGLRGLTIWYPDQDPCNVAPYPWAVRSLGRGCWVFNLNCGNAYQGLDFWTYPSDGHVIRYLCGAYFKKGLFISKCKGAGWVDDVHFNPHFSMWVDPKLKPILPIGRTGFLDVVDNVRDNLDGIVFGSCENEQVRGTFLFAAHEGIAFRSDMGGANARVIHHGTDTGPTNLIVEASGSNGIEFVGTQLTPVGKLVKSSIVVSDGFAGKASFFNTMIWGSGFPSATIGGHGDVLLQQFNSVAGPITIKSGHCRLENAVYSSDLHTHVLAEKGCSDAHLIGNISKPGAFRIDNLAAGSFLGWGNSTSLPTVIPEGPSSFSTNWNALDTGKSKLQSQAVGSAVCDVVDGAGRIGKSALRIKGVAQSQTHSYAYFKVFDTPLVIYPDSVLSYWIKPANALSQSSAIDLQFSDGTCLRDYLITADDGTSVHPAGQRGMIGNWKQERVPIGSTLAGKTITGIMFAFDGVSAGPFETLFDDVRIDTPLRDRCIAITASPVGGTYPKPFRVTLKSQNGKPIRYTLDGSQPNTCSGLYLAPIRLTHPGLWNLRFSVQPVDGAISSFLIKIRRFSRGKSPLP